MCAFLSVYIKGIYFMLQLPYILQLSCALIKGNVLINNAAILADTVVSICLDSKRILLDGEGQHTRNLLGLNM